MSVLLPDDHPAVQAQRQKDLRYSVNRLGNPAAPVVERQPAAELLVEFFEHGPMATIKWFTPSSFEHGTTKVYTAPPELAELQATIAQLTAENERLKDEATSQYAKRVAVVEEIERLKGGQV
jgi:uncharacterized small protein (DUF1192 family)